VSAREIVERLNETTLVGDESHLQILGIIVRLEELEDTSSIKTTDENNIKVSQVVIDRSFLGTTTSEAAATGLHHGSILLLFSEVLLEEASPHLIAHHN